MRGEGGVLADRIWTRIRLAVMAGDGSWVDFRQAALARGLITYPQVNDRGVLLGMGFALVGGHRPGFAGPGSELVVEANPEWPQLMAAIQERRAERLDQGEGPAPGRSSRSRGAGLDRYGPWARERTRLVGELGLRDEWDLARAARISSNEVAALRQARLIEPLVLGECLRAPGDRTGTHSGRLYAATVRIGEEQTRAVAGRVGVDLATAARRAGVGADRFREVAAMVGASLTVDGTVSLALAYRVREAHLGPWAGAADNPAHGVRSVLILVAGMGDGTAEGLACAARRWCGWRVRLRARRNGELGRLLEVTVGDRVFQARDLALDGQSVGRALATVLRRRAAELAVRGDTRALSVTEAASLCGSLLAVDAGQGRRLLLDQLVGVGRNQLTQAEAMGGADAGHLSEPTRRLVEALAFG
ncbi:MAG TPA: hypothetical protein VNL71_06990 [Chloroflexota bacterium]|nr:hypothetical protein [Chloroflexota bacterium]